MKIEAVVRRKTQDLVQDAAEDLLRETVEGIRRVVRAELWTFEVLGDDGREPVRAILDDTALVVNPNVHRYSLETWSAAPESGTRLLVRVEDRVDAKGAQVLRAIRERLGRREVTGASRAVLWTIDFEGSDAAEAERAGRRMIGDGRGAGILANSHSQDARVRVVAA